MPNELEFLFMFAYYVFTLSTRITLVFGICVIGKDTIITEKILVQLCGYLVDVSFPVISIHGCSHMKNSFYRRFSIYLCEHCSLKVFGSIILLLRLKHY